MTVRELIEELIMCPPDCEVVYDYWDDADGRVMFCPIKSVCAGVNELDGIVMLDDYDGNEM